MTAINMVMTALIDDADILHDTHKPVRCDFDVPMSLGPRGWTFEEVASESAAKEGLVR